MEHNLLTDLTAAARENVIQTYVSLASSLPGTSVLKNPHYIRVTGTLPLSFCHFAADFKPSLDPNELAETLRLEAQNPHGLWVFLLPGDEPEGLRNALMDQGFNLRQCLCQFGRQGSGNMHLELHEAEDADSRIRVGKFMAEQFFPFSPGESRSLVARSTAASPANLFYLGNLENPDAAMMLSKTRNSVGLYNLCVNGAKRNQKIGTHLVDCAQSVAHQYGLPLTLQCHASLRKWYERQNFKQIGTLQAFYCGSGKRTDIL